MVDDSIKPAEVGPWANEKLDALEHYLNYYTTRLKKQKQWSTIYLDAFAGGGRAVLRRQPKREETAQHALWDEPPAVEQQEFVKGSPRRALEIANPFDAYIFVDADPARVSMLRELKEEYGDRRKITVREGSADEQIAWVLSKSPNRRLHRGLAFLDPFGAHLSWETVRALAETGVFEVIINFPLHMCLNRLMTRNPDIPTNWRAQLDAFLPAGWYDEVYETTQTLLGEETVKRTDALDRVLSSYLRELNDAFGHVSAARLIRNTKGSPLYYLIWAGPHPAGLPGANHIMNTMAR